ncbi:(-)-alpha-amorphene synthase [Streptomyces sp. NPDC057623]|uniref:(-)-alpha-amorphene synthase n=1 Tax=Streptomyces sp. NPDC057623 TaxID=3346187 RepID=UPI003692F7A0
MSTTHEEIALTAPRAIPALNLRELIDANLYMPFPFQSNPHASEAAAGVDAWLRTWGLTDEPEVAAMISCTRPAELAAYNSPTVDSGLLQIMANQIAYQFIFDDRAEDVGLQRPGRLLPMLSESVRILRDGQRPESPLGAALADLQRQVQERCTPAQAARWAWNSREYVHGLLYEAVAQTHSAPVGSGLCRSIRSLIAGIEPFHPLCEAAQPYELAPEELRHPVVRRLGRLSVDAAVWTADLFSAVKEQRAGGVINLALDYQRAHQCSLPEAVTLAIRRINGTIGEFEELYGEIRPELSPAGVGYVEGMAGWIPGCYFWSRTVPRYADTMAASAIP